jgi:hypothetical protein
MKIVPNPPVILNVAAFFRMSKKELIAEEQKLLPVKAT